MDGKVNSESDSNENSFEIFVAEAAAAADPVVEVNGMKIWIQPLPAEHYNLKHGMTLNDFFALIGILNDPSKQAIYIDPLTGATYILNIFDGNMPLVDVLDLIGYDRTNLEQQFLGNAHRIQIIDTATILQLQDDTIALFHPDVSEEVFYRQGITDYQRSYFSKKVLDTFDIVKLRFQDTFRETIHESAYNIIKAKYSEEFGITQEEWLELVDSKAKDEHGAFTQEFEKIVDLCLKEQVFLNLIELSGGKDQDVDTIFSTLDTYLDENFGSLIEQLFAPLTFEAFISEVIDQILNNIENEGFVTFDVPTHEYFAELINRPLNQIALLSGGLQAPEMNDPIKIEADYRIELNNLALLVYKIIKFDSNQRGLTITDQLLNLHTSENSYQYTVKDLSDLLQKLGLTNDIFRSQKAFYKTILDRIHYLNEHTEISLNPEIREKITKIAARHIYQGEKLTLTNNKGYTDKEERILKILDIELNDLLGYVGYSLLQLGLIRFDIDGKVKFELPNSLKELKDHLKRFNIESIAHTGLNYFKKGDITNTELVEIITSILLSGHFKSIEKVDQNGKIIRNDWRYVYTHPPSVFLKDAVKNFKTSVPDPSYHKSIFYQIVNTFINKRIKFYELKPINRMGYVYNHPDYPGLYRVNTLRSLLYQGVSFNELDLKLMLEFGIIPTSITPIEIFDVIRNNYDGFQNEYHKLRPAMYFKFDFKYKNQADKSGFIFAQKSRNGLYLPGYVEPDLSGKLQINPHHSFALNYPVIDLGDGVKRTYDAERVGLFVCEDEEQLDVSNVEEGVLYIYSENTVCLACRILIAMFKINHPNIQIVIFDNLRENPNNPSFEMTLQLANEYVAQIP
ncbi:MAG: hypothetical protein ACFFB1_12845 [Promethearchaeota archaeon]